ncbi:RND transporter [Luteitalea sp. TBR-22]|uniref:efflux RND transporter periplasmic adaptor subunit n=1 Tax=Luteitalea sp. TBR-22 TaxID=2802971 RepID=UPI001AF4CB5C|nr:efflux RND transporter periplasmic adaptor subunit [Luteitalea sp. TBR-22]BCS33804.1 RND transporter [Luteitalea sp. TBR-22]
MAVSTVTVARAPHAALVEAGGLVQARTTAVVTSRLMAPVREVRVQPGDRVRAGQVLVVLDDRDLGATARGAQSSALAAEQAVTAGSADRRAAEAGLALARASYDRVVALHGRKSATTQELDQATASFRAAEAQLAAIDARIQQAQASLASARAGSEAASVTAGFAVVTAPFAGVVAEKLVEPGNMAAPGMPLLRLEDDGALRLDVRVDASRVAGLTVGQQVDVEVDAASPVLLRGTVSEVARAMDADARAYLLKIALPGDARLRSGMFGRVRFAGAPVAAMLVPSSAIVRHGQVTSVFVADGDVARLRMVVVGRTLPEGIEVVTGLGDGERVVSTPPIGLTDGTPLRAGAK